MEQRIAEQHERALARYLAPADPAKVSARIVTLLAHWFVPDMPFEVQKALVGDWVSGLAVYPWWAIERSCNDWLTSHSEKPRIADIAAGCRRAVAAADAERRALRKALASKPAQPAATVSPEKFADLARVLEATTQGLKP